MFSTTKLRDAITKIETLKEALNPPIIVLDETPDAQLVSQCSDEKENADRSDDAQSSDEAIENRAPKTPLKSFQVKTGKSSKKSLTVYQIDSDSDDFVLTREYVTNELLNGDLIPDGDKKKNQRKSSTQKTPKRTPARKAQKSKINYIESSEKSDSESDRNSENSDYNPSNDSNITDPSSEIKTNTKSRKLSEILGPESKKISKKFLQEKLVHEIYKFYNSQVFKNKLPENLSIKWSNRLNKTAGYCYLGSRMTGRDPVTGLAKFERTARIELASKVIDDRFKLRDTLLHELCHAASYLIDGVKDGHGKFFKKWGRHCNELLPDIPVVSRCHSYQINYKFVYSRLNSVQYSRVWQ